jgi:hypothetical protein
MPPAPPRPGEAPAPRPGEAPPPEAAVPGPGPVAEPTLGAEQAVAGPGGEVALSAPNMLGHLLFGSRSVTFRYNRAAGPVNVSDFGSTSIVNPAVADDNSPLPLDRAGFRFNYFDRAQQVTGFGAPVFNAAGVGTAFPVTKNYNVETYTFNVEKTFLDGLGSVELRVPFSTGLSSNLNLSASQVSGPAGTDGAFPVTATPAQTLGSNGTQFGNMTLIFKGLAYSCQRLSLSGGVALGIPSGDDTTVAITDYSGGTTQGAATIQRVRTVHIDNETWSLSPYVAYLATPTERLFAQGFLQFDFPLNDSTINYSNVYPRGSAFPLPAPLVRFPTLNPPFSVRGGIQEQALMQVDVGSGFWLLRDPSRRWLTGLAPTLELHYTTTLKNASIVTLPADNLLQIDPTKPGHLIQEQPPQVGNQRNRMDILDMTAGVTFLLSDRATVATGFAFPLRSGDNRTFDWEYLLQLNYYFGGGPSARRFAPSF